MCGLLIALLFLAQSETDTAVRIYPVDDTSRDTSFPGYVKKLRFAAEKRRVGDLRKLVDQDVVVGPDAADKGWKKFVAKWHPDDPESPLWQTLLDLLSLG